MIPLIAITGGMWPRRFDRAEGQVDGDTDNAGKDGYPRLGFVGVTVAPAPRSRGQTAATG